MPLLKIKHPVLVVLGFERTFELSCAFKGAGIQLKTVFTFLHQELDCKTFCSLAAPPFLSKEGKGDVSAFS